MGSVNIEKAYVRFLPALAAAVTISAAVIGAAVGGTWKISKILNDMRDDGKDTKNQVTALAGQVEDIQKKSYTLPAAAEQALRMAIANPTMKVPDPRDPSKLIQVDKR